MQVSRTTLVVAAALAGHSVVWCAQTVLNPQSLLLHPWRPPTGQSCAPAAAALPPLDSMLDTAQLKKDLALAVPGATVLAVNRVDWNVEKYGPRPDTVTVLESTLPDSLNRPIRSAFSRALRYGSWSAFLARLDFGQRFKLRVAPSLECLPTLANEAEIYRLLGSSVRGRLRPLSHSAMVGVIVRPDGTPSEPVITRSSGDAEFDGLVINLTELMRFHPGLIDRTAMPVRVAVPINWR